MKRHSSKVRGFVKFPVDDPEYQNSGEGGMLVRLAVLEKGRYGWPLCCGGF